MKRRTFLFVVGLFFVVAYYLSAITWDALQDQVHLCPWIGRAPGSCAGECHSRLREAAEKLDGLLDAKGAIEILASLKEIRHVVSEAIPELGSAEKDQSPFCPEIFKGRNYGEPRYEKGWEVAGPNCGKAVKINYWDAVSVVLNVVQDPDWRTRTRALLRDLSLLHPNATVLLAAPEPIQHSYELDLNEFIFPTDATPGTVLNFLIARVQTPFTLVSRDAKRVDKLDRLVRVVSSIPGVEIAAGAVRNSSGHWRAGCWQSSLGNYVLGYVDGYRQSRSECPFCGYVDGPFVANTTVLKHLQFDESFDFDDALYRDFFVRADGLNYGIVSCPDVTFDVGSNPALDRSHLLPVASKFQLNRIVFPSATFSFTCRESRVTCKRLQSLSRNYLVPVCCLEQFSAAMAFWENVTAENDIPYEITTGTVLGAVKLGELLPWDFDGDILYYTDDHGAILRLKEAFAERGYALSEYEAPTLKNYRLRGGILFLFTPDIKIEMYGEDPGVLVADELRLRALNGTDTRVRIGSGWVRAPTNPGLFARNRYGPQVLRHSQSWSVTGAKGSYSDYINAGRFRPCAQTDHQACLDHFPADGNIPFIVH